MNIPNNDNSVLRRSTRSAPRRASTDVAPDHDEYTCDEVLVARAQTGDVLALRRLFDRYEERLFRLAMRFVRNENDAREILQDVFVTAWRKLPGFEGRAQVSSWLHRVTANASLMLLRARSRRPTFAGALPGDLDTVVANSNHDAGLAGPLRPDELLALGELQQEIQGAVDKLPDMLRSVFLAREIEGNSTLQAARTLGVSEQVIKTRLHRARVALRENIGGYLAI